jgi:hypothetical protein
LRIDSGIQQSGTASASEYLLPYRSEAVDIRRRSQSPDAAAAARTGKPCGASMLDGLIDQPVPEGI